MRSIRKRKCKHCHIFFLPDLRNAERQRYCFLPECRKASKTDSQRRWLQRPENQDYFRGNDNVRRVQKWRCEHPGYWRHKTTNNKNALQDSLIEKDTEKQEVTSSKTKDTLQDVLSAQHAVFIGIIAHLTGNVLQDDIAIAARKLRQLGNDILNNPHCRKGGSYGNKIPTISTTGTQSSEAVQLGGSPSCP